MYFETLLQQTLGFHYLGKFAIGVRANSNISYYTNTNSNLKCNAQVFKSYNDYRLTPDCLAGYI